MRLKILGCLLAFLPLLLHAQEDEDLPTLHEMPTTSSPTVACETRYTTTWIHDGTTGHSWQMAWGLNLKAFDEWVKKWEMEGFRMATLGANGPADRAEFHGVMVLPKRRLKWAYKCDIEDLDKWIAGKDDNGISRVVSFRMYGELDNRRYCVLIHENRGNKRWALEHSEPGLMPDSTCVSEFNYPHVSRQFLHPAKLFMADDGVITPLMADMSMGGWSAAIRLNQSAMAKEIDRQGHQWFMPIDIQGASGFGKTQFNAVFAERTKYQSRVWAAHGQTSGFRNNERAKKELEKIMKDFIKHNGIRQAQISIGMRGHAFLERSYTYPESAYGTVKPHDVFLLGGVSKMFLYVAVEWCVDQLIVTYDTHVYKPLGYRKAFDKRVGLQLPHNGTEPATLHDLIEYKLKRRLDYNPGEHMVHSHYGSLLLGAVVANLTEMPYVDFLKKHILDGLGVSLFETDSKVHFKDKGEYVSGVYGGDGAIKEETAAAFSLRASATSVMKFAARHSVARIGKRKDGYRRGGIEGGYAYVETYGDFDFAILFNTREFASKNAVLGLAHDKIRNFIDRTVAEKKYGPFTLTCNPGPEIFDKAFPGLEGVPLDSLEHLPDCTQKELDEIMHDREDLD
ncbi:beta-lactamase/transpeptidase-like protein [Fusarium venenatum]|uniref:beta-lactamase/transpeptidase-like protein n=1 Tax=Fusarium venenatum TaxID=56646 RepID=UPI001DBF969E|nr:beta-lactamase/transpeptidase-like protein [Fusarium venenatum]